VDRKPKKENHLNNKNAVFSPYTLFPFLIWGVAAN
jgi:hypothetical protein